jgi:hypothetical protein
MAENAQIDPIWECRRIKIIGRTDFKKKPSAFNGIVGPFEFWKMTS